MEKPEVLSKEDYNLIHKRTAKKLLAEIMKNGILYLELLEIDTLRKSLKNKKIR